MCVVVTYDCDSWIKRGASRPAVAGSVSPEWEIFFRKSMELSYGVPEGVNGTRKKMSPVAWTDGLFVFAPFAVRVVETGSASYELAM